MQRLNVKTPGHVGGAGAGESKRNYSKRKSTLHGASRAHSGRFAYYESLKAQLTSQATCSAEYESACRHAALIAGV